MAVRAPGEDQLRLRPGVYSTVGDDGVLRLFRWSLWPHAKSFGAPTLGKRAVLRRLAEAPCARADLRTAMCGDELSAFLDALWADGWLTTTVRHQGRPLYTLQPIRRPCPVPDACDEDLVLSRFTVLHREDQRIVVESPLAWAQMQLHEPVGMALVGALAHRMSQGCAPDLVSADVAARMLRDLRWTGLAMPVPNPEDTELRFCQWRAHELWFHERSRKGNGGYFGAKYGRTQWGRKRFDPPPMRREPYPGPAVGLYRPDLDALRRTDPPLTAAVEDRRSVRRHDDANPLTVDQLGELLYRCARIRGSFTYEGMEYLSRPHPSGGSVYELELYPVVRRVSGLSPGMYHYDPHEHQLRLVRAAGPEVAQLLQTARRSAVSTSAPQVLIVIAARFGRLMWTYEEMPYALVLKHVGVLVQTMYLVATAMGLAACGLGGGDAAAFSEATGLDYTTESSVGEFILGSRLES